MLIANITVEAFALAVTLLLLLCSCMDKSRKGRMIWLIHAIIIGNAALLGACILTWAMEGKAQYEMLNTVMTAFANGLGFPMAGFYVEYVACAIGEHGAKPRRFALVLESICVLALVLNFVSIFNGMYFSCPEGVYTRGPLFMLNQSFSGIILLPNAYLILKHRRALGGQETVALLSFAMLPLFVALTQPAFSGITTMCLATTLTVVMIYISDYLRRGRKLLEQEQELTESRISIMLSQIQPHFLYNSLNSIGYLCEKDPPTARRAVDDFADYMRGNLDSLRRTMPVPFEKELEHVRIYLSLEKMRFDEELNIVWDIQADGFLLPALTIQPLVENAVKYGLGKKAGGGTVTITSLEYSDRFEVMISDDGVGYDPAVTQEDGRTHIGIDNVRSRLASMVGGALEIRSEREKGTTATIIIPKEVRS